MPSLRELMAAKKPPASGLKLSDPSAPMPGESQPCPPIVEEQGRQLQSAEAKGDGVPMEYPSENASPDEKLWWQARHSLNHDL